MTAPECVQQTIQQMREGWDTRARKDARYYVAFGPLNQHDGDCAFHRSAGCIPASVRSFISLSRSKARAKGAAGGMG